MILLGFGHRAHSGKSTCCDAILERANYIGISARVYSISDEVLSYCVMRSLLPDMARASMTNEHIKILVDVGKGQRDTDEDFWLKRLRERMAVDKPKLAMIPNIRYWNEAEWVRAEGGVNVLCNRLNSNGSPHISADRDANHISECDLWNWNWDYILTHKEGQEWWLKAQAVSLFEWLYERSR
jgi:hypothetical protein